jgi:hypothetical protein
MPPKQAAPGNGAIASWFHGGHVSPSCPEQRRLARASHHVMNGAALSVLSVSSVVKTAFSFHHGFHGFRGWALEAIGSLAIGTPNPAMAYRFHLGRRGRRVGEPRRSATEHVR